MAGFQDQLIGPSQYVETIPVDAYTRVGMIKQKQYDEGVQKVQGYIDSVAGIEALMPEQKDYLNKTVNQLQSQVSQIAGADFSNTQIVNSVGHLTKQMAADPIIQNTVYATNAYKQESAKMKQAQDEGKSSPANEYVFQRGIQNWLGSHDPSKSFDATYNPYVDYKGKMIKALNGQLGKADEYLTEMPYKRGSDGKVITDDHGQPVIDYAMMQETYKGVSAERIKNIIDSTLDENDKRQIAIDGQYEYRGYGKPELKDSADRSYQSRLDQINSAIQGIQVEKSKNSTDVNFQNQADAQIARLGDQAKSLQSSYLSDIDHIDKDPESYKSSLYGQNWLSKFSEGYSYAQHSLKFVENPFFMAAQKERENNIRFDEFQETRQYHYDQLAQERLLAGNKDQIEREKLQVELIKAHLKRGKNGEITDDGGGGVQLSDQSIPEEMDVTTNKSEKEVVDNIAAQTKALDAAGMELLFNTDAGKGIVEQIPITDANGKRGIGYGWKGATQEEKEHNATAGKATILSMQDGTYTGTPEPQITNYFNKYQATIKDINDQKQAIRDAQNLVDKDPALSMKDITKGIKNLYVEGNGTKYTITPEQMISFNKKLSSTMTGFIPGVSTYNDEVAQRIFQTPAEKFLYSVATKPLNKQTASDRFIISKLSNIHNNVNAPSADRLEARDAAITDALSHTLTRQQPVSTALEQFKAADHAQAINLGRQMLHNTSKLKGVEGENYDPGVISKMLDDKNSAGTSIFLVNRGDGKLSLRFTNESVSPDKRREINLNESQANDLFGSQLQRDTFLSMQRSINMSRLGGVPTTNVQRQGATTAMPLNNGQFKNYNVKFDVEQVGGDRPDSYQIRIYAFDKQTNQSKTGVINPGGGILFTQAQVLAALGAINDETVTRVTTPPSK